MIPDKIHWFMGYNNLGVILEQERKHWLLKTDKKKQIQDKKTGDVFQGQIDNLGSDIILETEKLPIKYDVIQKISYKDQACNDILDISYATFTHSTMVNGLMFARIVSINFPLIVGTETQFKHYKLKLENCTTCIIPFGASINSDKVFSGKWLKTTSVPKVMLLDELGNYTIERDIEFVDGINNPVFYYPLTETLQPLNLDNNGNGTYTTQAVNDNGFIGYPLYWFTCDESINGPSLSFSNNHNSRNEQLMFVSNEGNASKYNTKLYVNVDGNNDATPDGSPSSNFKIICTPKNGKVFNNVSSDFDVPLDITNISFYNKSTLQHHVVGIACEENDVLTMSKLDDWVYVNDTAYEIDMDVFDTNCLEISSDPLISIFDMSFDTSVSYNTTTDVGYTGIYMSSSNIHSDILNRYPHGLNEWDGLPEWMNDIEADKIPQHMAIYAIHNTPGYIDSVPDSRQTAALLLDPGKVKTSDEDTDLSNDERGRVYVLSNDGIEYENNLTTDHPKPARTVARICDIPTSVMQLSNIHGLAPTSIVDKKYVRSETSFTLDDKDRLYNDIGNRWVKPIDLDSNGNPLTDKVYETNDFVFSAVSSLESVDLVNHNNYRYHTKLNPMVDPYRVSVSSISERGSGYAVNDIGVVVVGGFAFHYTVTEIDDNGGVITIALSPASTMFISLSNFDMSDDNSGITDIYGTSPLTGTGTGLKFRFIINDYLEIQPSVGEIFDGLYAFVKENDGLWLYVYDINEASSLSPKEGVWVKKLCVSEYENSSTSLTGGLSTPDAFINSIIPSFKNISVNKLKANDDPVNLLAITTSSFINILDKTKTPISNNNNSILTEVDLCKFYCDGIRRFRASAKTPEAVLDDLCRNRRIHFDSYVFWNWVSPSDPSNLYFNYGVIRRSLNNFVTSDYTTTLPVNKLKYPEYVHVNANTTVVWDVENIGTMMWIYNPSYQKHETYKINPETNDLYIDKKDITWADIDVRDSRDGTSIKLVGPNGNLLYYIMTNNPVQAGPLDPTMLEPDPIYQQPDFVQFNDLKPGTNIDTILKEHQPMGNWQLVFPRIETFHLSNSNNSTKFVPIKLQTIKQRNVGEVVNVLDEYDNNVNAKTLILDETSSGIRIKTFNTETGIWETI